MKNKSVHLFIISTFVGLYLIVSVISTIHVIEFFELSNPKWLAISLALAFEIGAAASLSSIIVLDKMNKFLVWSLFIILTSMQAMGNTYYAYTHLKDFQYWVELFGLVDEDVIYQKRILSLISGAILPLVSLGFIKSLVDYINPKNNEILEGPENPDGLEEKEDSSNLISNSEKNPLQSLPSDSVINVPVKENPQPLSSKEPTTQNPTNTPNRSILQVQDPVLRYRMGLKN